MVRSPDTVGPSKCGLLLIEQDACDLEAIVDDDNNTCLLAALVRGMTDVVQALLRKRCSVRHVNKEGRLAVCTALALGQEDTVAKMMAADTRLDPPLALQIQPSDKLTVLETAMRYGTELVRIVTGGSGGIEALLKYSRGKPDAHLTRRIEEANRMLEAAGGGGCLTWVNID